VEVNIHVSNAYQIIHGIFKHNNVNRNVIFPIVKLALVHIQHAQFATLITI